jgi:ubiquinone/menaquinone biosynthesis C-methylase UbiE
MTPFVCFILIFHPLVIGVLGSMLPTSASSLKDVFSTLAVGMVNISSSFGRIPETLIGVDVNPDVAALGRKSGVYRKVHAAPADEIPEPDASFDHIFANCSLEHMDNLDAVLTEIKRCLKPGGTCALQCGYGSVCRVVAIAESRCDGWV